MGYTIQHNSIFWPTANCGVILFVLDQLGREKFRNTWEKKKKNHKNSASFIFYVI